MSDVPTPLPSLEPEGPPSLGNLPPELKLRIAELVDEVDEEADMEEAFEDLESDDEEEDDGADQQGMKVEFGLGADLNRRHAHEEHVHGEDCDHDHEEHSSVPSSMANLSLVSTEFAGLAQPFLWKVSLAVVIRECADLISSTRQQHVDFAERSTESALHFAKEILPRHARHVQGLTFAQEERDLPSDDVVESIECAVGVDDGGLSWAERRLRGRRLLFADIISRCPHLDTLDCQFATHDSLTSDPVHAAAVKVGHQIVDLTLSAEPYRSCREEDAARFLSHFPNLLRLDLALDARNKNDQERLDLIQSIVAMEKLETLSLVSAPFVNDNFANAEWKAPLNILALANVENLSLPSFRTLVHKFRNTLTVLDIDDAPENSNEKDNKKYLGLPLDLPKLDTLVLSTFHGPAFLSSFDELSLVEFTLGFCPSISFADLESFITRHSTLERLTVESRAGLSDSQVESLEVLCYARGIDCKVELSDEEDSEMDYSEGSFEEESDDEGSDDDSQDDD